MPGSVCRTPTPRMTDSAFPAARSSDQPERDGEEHRDEQRDRRRARCGEARGARSSIADRRDSPPETRGARPATSSSQARPQPTSPSCASASRATRGHGFSLDLDALVQRAHPRDVDLTAELLERGDRARLGRGKPRAHERRGFVWREEMAIVAKHREVVARDQSVGRVAVDDVDLPGGERLILDRRSERTHVAKVQIVGVLKSDETVGSSDEIGGEAGAQLARVPREIAERLEVQRVCRRATHGDRVAVLETQRREPADAPPSPELGRHAAIRVAGAAARSLVKNREESGARVLRIDVDGARLQRAEREVRRAETRPAVDAQPARLEQLREHLGEEIRLAEGFRRDDDRTVRRAALPDVRGERDDRGRDGRDHARDHRRLFGHARPLQQQAHVVAPRPRDQLRRRGDLLDPSAADDGDASCRGGSPRADRA